MILNILASNKKISIPNNLRLLIFGGALNSNCFRDKFLQQLKKRNNYLSVIPDKINYFDISSQKYDLIEKETRLFENSDILIIIPESPGSFAEIGMVASMINNHKNNAEKEKHAKKILILLDKKYKYDESFIKNGPVKIIKTYGGKSFNIDYESNDFSYIFKNILVNNKTSNKVSLSDTVQDTKELFYINCIKILIYIYYHKRLCFMNKEYNVNFISDLKKIHKSISFDNIEYLESTDLIKKTINNAILTIEVNHKHSFIKSLIDENLLFLKNNNIIYNFLRESGY